MINADAFNEVMEQLGSDNRAKNALIGSSRKTAYYEITPETRELVGRSLRQKLARLKDEEVLAIRGCIKALRNIYGA